MIEMKNFRPKNFSEVIGNQKVLQNIRISLANGFYDFTILHGEEGIGKTTVSKLIAKAITCENPKTGLPCNQCYNCKEVDEKVIGLNKNSTRVFTYKMSDEGGKTSARNIQTEIQQLPFGGGKKVIILEECQGMREEAQDLLLPILEYIPSDVHIIACTTNLKGLQRTFTSRAMNFHFRTPASEDTALLIKELIDANGLKLEDKSIINKIVEFSDSKPRKAIRTLFTLANNGEEITLADTDTLLGEIDERHFLSYLNYLKGDMGTVIDFIKMLKDNNYSLIDFVNGLNKFIMKLVTFKYRKAYFQESMIDSIKRFIKVTSDVDLLKMQSIIADNAPDFKYESHAEYMLVSLSFKLMNVDKDHLYASSIKNPQQVVLENQLAIQKYQERKRKQEQEEALNNNSSLDITASNFINEFKTARVKKE